MQQFFRLVRESPGWTDLVYTGTLLGCLTLFGTLVVAIAGIPTDEGTAVGYGFVGMCIAAGWCYVFRQGYVIACFARQQLVPHHAPRRVPRGVRSPETNAPMLVAAAMLVIGLVVYGLLEFS